MLSTTRVWRRGCCRTTLLFAAYTAAMSSSSSASLGTAPSVKPLLTPSEVLSSPSSFKFVDGSYHINKSRDALAEFHAERIPGARFFDIDAIADKTSSLPHMLPSNEEFSLAMQDLGLENDDHIVVYTSKQCFSSCRVWWTLRAFGHSKVSVLNGGIEGWKKSGGLIEKSPPSANQPRARPFAASLDKRFVVDWREVKSIVESGSAQIVDARSSGRFLAEAPEPRPGLLGGHIPGSLSLPFTALTVDGDPTTFKSPSEIRDALIDCGVIMGSRVVTTCGSGVTAAIITFAMELMGKDVTSTPVYDGSWSEWGDPALSMERGLPIVGKKEE